MLKGLKLVIILLTIPIIFLGLNTMFDPSSMIEKWGMTPIGNTGLNSLRSIFPGILLGSAILIILGFVKKESTWFIAASIVMLVVAFGRFVSFIIDGFDMNSIPTTIYEITLSLLLIYYTKLLKTTE